MPHNDPTGYLPRVQRNRRKRGRGKLKALGNEDQLGGKLAPGLGAAQTKPTPRTFQPVKPPSSSKRTPRKKTYSPRPRRSA